MNQPVSHIKSTITFNIMTDNVELPLMNIPSELHNLLK